MRKYTVPAMGRRSVLVRPGFEGDHVQLGILSVHGNIIESVGLDATQLPGVVGALRRAQVEADRDLMAALKRRQVEGNQRYAAALARNPWLNGSKSDFPNETYIGRPR